MSAHAIHDCFLDTVGKTPLVRLPRLSKHFAIKADVCAKLEFFNPLSSVKDRIGRGMILAMEREGIIDPLRSVLIEPTSGNTGIALAFAAAARGYRLILTMPESMSMERRKILRLLGAELELTDSELGMPGAMRRAEELCAQIPGAIMPQQFSNPANPQTHYETTAKEILDDTNAHCDALVVTVGTGGTLTGIGKRLRESLPDLKIIAVEPETSPVLQGGKPGPHDIQGIGAGFIPDVLDTNLIDEVLGITSNRAIETARLAALYEGMPVGISSGASLAATFEIAARPSMQGKRIVTVLASAAERYLTTDLFQGL
ncbi:MAG: cysteine synthase A [Pseudomonadota bacterium]